MDLEAARWAAIVKKDAASDGAFVYCVRSTKICCRPTCRARLPRRANIMTYKQAHEAMQAGYRPCKRCRPELASYTPQDDMIQKACDIICSYSLGLDNPRLAQLAEEVGLTKYHFHRLFKRKVGLTPKQFAQALRASDAIPDLDLVGITTPSLVSEEGSLAAASTGPSPASWLSDSISPIIMIAVPAHAADEPLQAHDMG